MSNNKPCLLLLAASLTAASAPVLADNLVEVARKDGNLTVLLEALEATGMLETLADQGPFTLLAPSDEAFGKLRAGTMDMLLKLSNRDQLTEILQYHVVEGVMPTQMLRDAGSSITSLAGQTILLSGEDGIVLNDEAVVVHENLQADNGILHVIDAVIFPE